MTNTNMEQQQSSYKEKERIELHEPRRFKVIIFNDDFTTMEQSLIHIYTGLQLIEIIFS